MPKLFLLAALSRSFLKVEEKPPVEAEAEVVAEVEVVCGAAAM
jgi:hypothetical protein